MSPSKSPEHLECIRFGPLQWLRPSQVAAGREHTGRRAVRACVYATASPEDPHECRGRGVRCHSSLTAPTGRTADFILVGHQRLESGSESEQRRGWRGRGERVQAPCRQHRANHPQPAVQPAARPRAGRAGGRCEPRAGPLEVSFRLAAPEHLPGWGGRVEQLAAQCKHWRASRPLPAVQPSAGPRAGQPAAVALSVRGS